MFIETVPNRQSPPAVLLRESFRDENGKSQKRTLANLSKLPGHVINGMKALLKGGQVVGTGADGLRVERSLPHGHVVAGLGMVRKIGLDRLLLSTAKDAQSRRHCDLVVGMIVDRLVTPRSKLGFTRAVNAETACSSLGAVLGLGSVAEHEVYAALDWLGDQQRRVETGLARRHLKDGTLVLYDVSSSYFEGRRCPLARFGHSRDKRRDRPQIVYGVLCTKQGLPLAVEVFDGNTADPTTVSAQVDKLKQRFRLSRVVLVGDRGMITTARIRDDLQPAGLDWISCLRAPQVQALARDDGPLQLSLFDDRDLAEVESPDYPGERLIVCRNPELAVERGRKRSELLEATERDLARIQQRVGRAGRPLNGAAAIGQAVGAVIGRRKVGKHFKVTITDTDFAFERDHAAIAAEARLDGIYVIRTSVEADALSAGETVQAYKDLSRVERAFRCLKTVDLDIRPIRHWTEKRVRAHVFLCMVTYHVEWHLRQALAPLLFHDTDLDAARAERASPVVKTEPSQSAKRKKARKRNASGLPVMDFADLLSHLGTLAANTMVAPLQGKHTFTLYTRKTPLQQAAFELLGFDPVRVQ
ncbi:IS1634 family transposase [Rhizobium leguminosarum]|uniref:IS1634 family transposase n=1 Tax=Rhizobium leguminosarum TaxID=384 RepID=UPI001441F223|nr:IS1634 family transposase [Rhizobium leguminosarum]NKL81413.1 IS1634 family transposase [Rhizobium leguminosarum bv. viciae]